MAFSASEMPRYHKCKSTRTLKVAASHPVEIEQFVNDSVSIEVLMFLFGRLSDLDLDQDVG